LDQLLDEEEMARTDTVKREWLPSADNRIPDALTQSRADSNGCSMRMNAIPNNGGQYDERLAVNAWRLNIV
jgi:hypothetical protein